MNINGIELPAGYNGIGMHDTPGAGNGEMSPVEARSHAQMLLAHGVTLYKVFTEQLKVNRARAYIEAGILPIVRFWEGNQHWGRNPQQWVTVKDDIQLFADVGVRLMELGGNEFNIACEWKNNHVPGDPGVIARTVVDAWEVMLQRASEVPGCIPLFPSNTPGGNVDHRLCYPAICTELQRRGLEDTVQHIAVHPRPHNNPPGTKWTATNTVTFDEWRWIREQFEDIGVDAFYWATEHGYSLGDSQNAEYPPIDLSKHTAYNWELQVRMNPAHPEAIEPELAGTFHWFEAGYGHWGAWFKDALRDSPAPEMPEPSPLWDKMGNDVGILRFERYKSQPPPPPPPTGRAKGLHVSYVQQSGYTSGIDWAGCEDAGYTFGLLRTSQGRFMDSSLYFHHNRMSGDSNLLRGGWHYLDTTHDRRQGRFAAMFYTSPDLTWEIPPALDVEENDLTANQVRKALERMAEKAGRRVLVYTSQYKWHRIVGRGATWAPKLADLWVADARKGIKSPLLPDVWSTWEFWHYGQAIVPGWSKKVDVDWYNGTVDELQAKYGGGVTPPDPPDPPQPPNPPPDESLRILDKNGNKRDWAWLTETYGDVQIVKGNGTFRITELREVEGPVALVADVGAPDVPVVFWWPDAPPLAPQYHGCGIDRGVIVFSKENGLAEFVMGGGAYYYPPTRGPHAAWVGVNGSDCVNGLGMLGGTNHRHLDMVWRVGE